jgi:H+-transporting ATPase
MIHNLSKVTKGAPHVLAQLCGDASINTQVDKDVTRLGNRGIRALAVAICTNHRSEEGEEGEEGGEGKGVMIGLLTVLDPPRHDTKETIARAQAYGVEVGVSQ